jgi:hypothetical protein
MSGKNYRTWQNYRVGHLLFTVLLDPQSDSRNITRHKALESTALHLVTLMDRFRLPATWAASDPAQSAATSMVLRSDVSHEMAVLGDTNWIGPTAGRTRFARELARRVTQARATGLEISTLVPRAASIAEHIDLVVKQQLTSIVGCEAPDAKGMLRTPVALHYGVWEFPITAGLPAPAKWYSTPGWSLWRRIRRAARDASSYHVVIDAPAMSEDNGRSERIIAWLMRRVATLRDRGLVRVETMRTAAARLSNVPAVKPQRSILRAA